MPAESWIMRKISEGLAVLINNALLVGDGVGKPMGILNPNAGIPIVEADIQTPPGEIRRQDLWALRWTIPVQWQSEASYIMNQYTWAYLACQTDASGRPLFAGLPGGEPGFTLGGAPVQTCRTAVSGRPLL